MLLVISAALGSLIAIACGIDAALLILRDQRLNGRA